MPIPYYEAWDLFFYQNISYKLLQGDIRFLYGDLNPYTQEFPMPVGFSILQANICLITNMDFYYLLEFNKLGYIFTLGLSILWIYLIIFKLINLVSPSIICSLFIAQFGGFGIITPRYFLPSSFAWQIGFALMYITLKYYKYKDKSIESNSHLPNLWRGVFIYGFLIFLMFCFHFYVSIVIVISLIIIISLKSEYSKKISILLYLILIVLIMYTVLGRIYQFPLIEETISSIFGNANFYSFENLLLFLDKSFSLIIVFFSLIFSIYLLSTKKNKKYNWVCINFLIFLTIFFQPLPFLFRMEYIIVFFSFIIFAIFLSKLNIIFHFIEKKISSCYRTKIFKEKVFKFIAVALFILVIVNITEIRILKVPIIRDNNRIIVNGRVYQSTYTLEEFNAALWIYNNIDIQQNIALTDPGTGLVFSAISGLQYYKFINTWNNFTKILTNFSEQGISLNDLFILKNYLNEMYLYNKFTSKKHLLILSPRTHKIIFTNNLTDMFFFAEKVWINFTTLNNIEKTEGIEKIYSNSEVYIYLIEF